MKPYPILWSAIAVLASTLLLATIMAFQPAHGAGPWYVAPWGSDGNSCLSIGAPCATINGAIGKGSPGDTINVAIGIYDSSPGPEVVFINKNITLSGGWNSAFTAQTGMSTIQGSLQLNGLKVDTGKIASINHFTFQGGWAYGVENYGTLSLTNINVMDVGIAGIYTQGALTINDSILTRNALAIRVAFCAIQAELCVVTITNSLIISNYGYGIEGSQGTVTISDSTISGNAAYGIYNGDGELVVNNSTISNNSPAGIHTNGKTTLNNSTVSSNIGQGGVVVGGNTVVLNNSTVSGNINSTDGGGGITNAGTLVLNNSTVTNNRVQYYYNWNSGGIFNYTNGTAMMQNSIIADNSAPGPAQDCKGEIISLGYNLVENITDCIVKGDTTGNITGLDPLLGPLQDNGGPTFTQAFKRLSPAINAGNPAGCTDHLGFPLNTDQRGVSRVGRCDIGAYEYNFNREVYLPLALTFNSCPPLYADDFSDPTSGWPVGYDGDIFFEYPNGEYRILVRPMQRGAGASPGFQATDYSVSVNLRNQSGLIGSYGIAFGIAGDWSSFYTLEIFPDGWYGIYRYDPGEVITLAEAFSPAIYQGTASNLIKVERIGASINAYANGQFLASVTDGTYTGSRNIGLIVFSYYPPNVDIRFDNFTVYPTACQGTNVSMRTMNGGSTIPSLRLFHTYRVEKDHSKSKTGQVTAR